MDMQMSVTAEQMDEIEHATLYQYGLQMIQLVENAGRGLARVCRFVLGGRVLNKKIIVLASGGKSSAGGLAAARNLHDWGASLSVALVVPEDSLKRSALIQFNIIRSMDISIKGINSLNLAFLKKFDLIIDALFGHELKSAPAADFAHVISLANKAKRPIVSLDMPSGINATTGKIYNPCVKARSTVALALPKTGLFKAEVAEYVGELWLADIGVPPEVYAKIGLDGANPFIEDDLIRIRPKEEAVGIIA